MPVDGHKHWPEPRKPRVHTLESIAAGGQADLESTVPCAMKRRHPLPPYRVAYGDRGLVAADTRVTNPLHRTRRSQQASPINARINSLEGGHGGEASTRPDHERKECNR
jgi:hypothetical protein